MMNEDIRQKASIILNNTKEVIESIDTKIKDFDDYILEFGNEALIRKNLEDRIIECNAEFVINVNAINNLLEGMKHISSTIDENNINDEDIKGLTVLNDGIGSINDALTNLDNLKAEMFTVTNALDRFNKLTGYNTP